MKKIVVVLLGILLNSCGGTEITEVNLQGIQFVCNQYYYHVQLDDGQPMKIMYYSPNGTDITIAVHKVGVEPIFMRVNNATIWNNPYNSDRDLLIRCIAQQGENVTMSWPYITDGYTMHSNDITVITVISSTGSLNELGTVLGGHSIEKISTNTGAKEVMDRLIRYHESLYWERSAKK